MPLSRDEMRTYQRQRRARLRALAVERDVYDDEADRTAVLKVTLRPSEVRRLRALADAAGVTEAAYARAAIRGRLSVER